MFRYAEGAVIALKNDRPGLNLSAGDPDVIWALYETQPPMYEVTFRDETGQDFDLTLSEEEILTEAPVKDSDLVHAA